MAFLTLNGITIPTAVGGEVTPQVIGGMGRAYDGTMRRDRRAIKRRWRFKTPPLAVATAQLVRSIVESQGHLWTFDSDTYSEGGLPAASSSRAPDIVSSEAADGDDVALLYSAPSTSSLVAKRGGAAAYFSIASTNLVADDLADAENDPLNDYTNLNSATLANETTERWQGSQCIKITTTAGGQRGAYTGLVAIPTPGVPYTGSLFLKGAAGGETVTVQMLDGLLGLATVDVILSATEWRRVWVSFTAHGSATDVSLFVFDTNAGDAQSWYCDGWQVEKLSYPTWWMEGGSTRATEDWARYHPGFITDLSANARGLTLHAWTNWTAIPSGDGNSFLAAVTADVNNRVLLYSTSGSRYPRCTILKSGELNENAIYAVATTYGVWQMLTGVYDRDAATLKLYTDGVLRDTEAVGYDFDLATAVDTHGLSLGNNHDGNSATDGAIDDAIVLPYAVDADTVTAWYNSGDGFTAANPFSVIRPYLSGDVVSGELVQVLGRVKSSKIVGTVQAGSWDSAARVLDFELLEY